MNDEHSSVKFTADVKTAVKIVPADQTMTVHAGVWIDQSKAVVVRFSGDEDENQSIVFEQGSVESMAQDLFNTHRKEFIEKVMLSVRDAEAVLIFGPDETKVELSVCLNGDTLGEQVAGIETAGNMTDLQITEKIRKHFFSSTKE